MATLAEQSSDRPDSGDTVSAPVAWWCPRRPRRRPSTLSSRRVQLLALVATATVAVALAGCGSTHVGGSATTNATTSTTAAPNATTTTSGGGGTTSTTGGASGRTYNLTASFTTQAGYSFHVTAQATIGTPGIGDASQLPRAQQALIMPVSGSEIVENTTPGGRNSANDPADGATLIALYKSPTPVCPVASTGPLDALYMDLNHNVYCIVDLVAFQDTADNGVASGKSVTETPSPSTCQDLDNIAGGCGTVPAPAHDTSFVYLSANEHAALTALSGPPDLVVLLGASGGDIPTNSCQPSDTLGWVMASTQPITSCS